MSPSSPVRRLAVVLAAGSILLIPLSAAAISPAQIAEAVPAVAAPSRWQSLRDLALRYESQTQSLEQLGLDSQAIVRLWNRFGGDLSQVVKESALSPAWAQVLAQPNSREELLDRAQDELCDLSIAVAEKVIHVSLKSSREVILRMVQMATERLRRREWVRIYIGGCDSKELAQIAPELTASLAGLSDHIKLIPMADDESGTCIIEMPDEIIDASASTQLDNLKDILRGG